LLRVFGWSNAAGGVHHYRIREPLRSLALRGHFTKSLPAVTAELFETWDVVLVRGLHHPQNSLLWRWAAQTGKPALRVYDLDDDIWAWHEGSTEDRYWTEERRLNAELNIQAADLVTTPSDGLAQILSELNARVAVLPNTIPEKLLQVLPERREGFIIGWQGAQQHVKDLQEIYTPVLRFMLRHSDVQFHVWGPQGIHEEFPLANRVVAHPWINSVWGHYFRLNMDVGLAPLNRDTFNATKSDIRIREYAALGIPFIASRSDAYTRTAEAARGMVVESAEEWEEALEELYRNANLRAWMTEQGRLRARLWTTENNGVEWERVYERAINARNLRTAAGYPSAPIVQSPLVNRNGDGDRTIENVISPDVL
jgi:glycosyltransferase involved in cell wall biosynthesis